MDSISTENITLREVQAPDQIKKENNTRSNSQSILKTNVRSTSQNVLKNQLNKIYTDHDKDHGRISDLIHAEKFYDSAAYEKQRATTPFPQRLELVVRDQDNLRLNKRNSRPEIIAKKIMNESAAIDNVVNFCYNSYRINHQECLKRWSVSKMIFEGHRMIEP